VFHFQSRAGDSRVVIGGVDVDDPLAMVVGATELALVGALQVSLE
jgi:hypothetical protein